MGKIEIKIQTEERMRAITNLAIALKEVAKSLNRPPEINIKDCSFSNVDVGLKIEKLVEDSEEIKTINME